MITEDGWEAAKLSLINKIIEIAPQFIFLLILDIFACYKATAQIKRFFPLVLHELKWPK